MSVAWNFTVHLDTGLAVVGSAVLDLHSCRGRILRIVMAVGIFHYYVTFI